MWGVIPIDKNTFSSPVISISSLDQDSELLHAMVTCHTLTIIREKICGDPMDLKVNILIGEEKFSKIFNLISILIQLLKCFMTIFYYRFLRAPDGYLRNQQSMMTPSMT